MDLIHRAPNGRLDALAACRLLWCGALSFDDAHVTWDGTTHHAQAPAINDDVISLYGVPHDEAASVIPDLLDLLNVLAQDEGLRVPDEQIAGGVRSALAGGHLSGVSLFLLQCDTHPLIVEPADKDRILVRYDRRLARGIPHLQDLLCRMLCHLRLFCGDVGPFTTLFAENDAVRGGGRALGLQDFEGCVEGGCARLDDQAEVTNDLAYADLVYAGFAPAGRAFAGRASDGQDFAGGTADSTQTADARERERLAEALRSNARVTQALMDAMAQRIASLQEARETQEHMGPDPDAKARRDAAATSGRRLPGGAKAARSLAMRSAVYIAVGLVLMWLGRCCLIDGASISKQLADLCEQALIVISDGMNIILMKTSKIGSHEHLHIPPDLFVGVLRIVGFALVGLGILVPVRKILKLRRRLSREMSINARNTSRMAELVDKRRLAAEADYSEALGDWAAHLQSLEDDAELARASLDRLEQADKDLQVALAKLEAQPADGEPGEDSVGMSRSEQALLTRVRTASSEDQRHRVIAEHCDQVQKSVELAMRAM